jgi:hypothetical protein
MPSGGGDVGRWNRQGLGDLAGGALDGWARRRRCHGGGTGGGHFIVALRVMGAGSLALLFFGWDVLLAVAVELAFSVALPAWRGVERAGWLSAAVRLT